MAEKASIGIGLMGLGVVGGGVARTLAEKGGALAKEAGGPLNLRRVLVRDRAKKRPLARHLLTTDPQDLLADPRIDILIEAMGGESPALEYIQAALGQGKQVVTANKEVIAKHGPRLFALAQEHGVNLLFEASVGGGIPLIGPFQQNLLANRVSALHAIINGTTNYILTRMAKDGLEFQAALQEAQELGYAEPNPENDLEGIDAAYKLAILASLAFHTWVYPEQVYREGISRLAARDFRYARELGYAIKLLAIAREEDGAVQARVHPTLLEEDLPLAKVDGVFNAVQVEGDLVGRLLFYGRGAGALPTASAILSDVIQLAQGLRHGGQAPRVRLEEGKAVKPMAQVETRYYLRMNVADRSGVLAQIARVLGDLDISIASVLQKEADPQAQTAEIVIMTHPSREWAMQQALAKMKELAVVREVSNFLRVEG